MLRGNRACIISTLLLSFQLGCISGSIRRVVATNELPTELPKELKEKFEIKEIAGPAPSSAIQSVSADSPPPAASPDTSKKTRKKKGRRKSSLSAAHKGQEKTKTPAFVYPVRRPAKDPIWVGEHLVYSITYFGMSAGDFTLEILPYKTISARKVYHIRGNAVSTPVFSLFYRLNDVVESFMDYEGEFSHRFHIVLDETKQSRDALELYDSEKAQTFYWNRWNHKVNGYKETKEFAPIQPFSQDSLSALYYVRTIPLPPGTVVTFPVVSEAKGWEAVCTVVRREKMRTPMGRLDTIVIRPEMKYQGILKKSGDSYLWLTDDDRRIPVRLEAKVRIGTVVASLIQAELGTPPTSPESTPSPSPIPEPSPR